MSVSPSLSFYHAFLLFLSLYFYVYFMYIFLSAAIWHNKRWWWWW